MRKSRVLRQMRAGKVATCVKLNLSDPRNAEIAAMCGFDCVWIDLEHVPNNMTCVEDTVRAAKIHDVDVLTRVSKGCYSDMVRPLEGDSAGIMVPHLMSLEEAIEFITDDELIEVTPKSIRLRKKILDTEQRMKYTMRLRRAAQAQQ